MKSKLIIIGLFVVLMIIQLAVPTSMIWSNENTLLTGEIFRFETEPIDPSDPFRGKYVTLRFKEDEVDVSNGEFYNHKEEIYVSISVNDNGYAIPISVSKTEPSSGHYFKAMKQRHSPSSNRIRIDYTFNRFYMNERKAKQAELAYFDSNRDTTKKAYAQVRIKDGNSVLENVFIDGVELKKIAEMRMED